MRAESSVIRESESLFIGKPSFFESVNQMGVARANPSAVIVSD